MTSRPHKPKSASGGSLAEQLVKVGLKKDVGGEIVPLRAAVLLLAEEPGGLLAAYEVRRSSSDGVRR